MNMLCRVTAATIMTVQSRVGALSVSAPTRGSLECQPSYQAAEADYAEVPWHCGITDART